MQGESIIQGKDLDWTGDINLGVVRVETVLKAMRPDEIARKNEEGSEKTRGI